MFYLTSVDKILRHCHYWLARQYLIASTLYVCIVLLCTLFWNKMSRDM